VCEEGSSAKSCMHGPPPRAVIKPTMTQPRRSIPVAPAVKLPVNAKDASPAGRRKGQRMSTFACHDRPTYVIRPAHGTGIPRSVIFDQSLKESM